MSGGPITTQRVRDAVRVCAPISVRSILQALAKDDDTKARAVRRCVTELLKRNDIACAPGPGRADRRVLIAVQQRAPVPAPPADLPRTPPRIGRYRPPMPRERAPHLIPAPALQPHWPAHHTTGAVLAPRITGGFIHG